MKHANDGPGNVWRGGLKRWRPRPILSQMVFGEKSPGRPDHEHKTSGAETGTQHSEHSAPETEPLRQNARSETREPEPAAAQTSTETPGATPPVSAPGARVLDFRAFEARKRGKVVEVPVAKAAEDARSGATMPPAANTDQPAEGKHAKVREIPRADRTEASAATRVAELEESVTKIGTNTYAREIAERAAFKAADHTMHTGTVALIQLGGVQTTTSYNPNIIWPLNGCTGHDHQLAYIWGIGTGHEQQRTRTPVSRFKKDDRLFPQSEPHKQDTDPRVQRIRNQIEAAKKVVVKHRIDDESGPYADRATAIVSIAKNLLGGEHPVDPRDVVKVIERVMDAFRVRNAEIDAQFPREYGTGISFVLSPGFMPLDELPKPAEIFTQTDRFGDDPTTGERIFAVTHPIETYLLATAVLRELRYDAHLAIALQSDTPPNLIVAIFDPKPGVQLATFDLIRHHPPAGAIEVLSDRATEAVLYTNLAITRMKHLGMQMVQTYDTTDMEISDEEVTAQQERIARCLFEAAKRWPAHSETNALRRPDPTLNMFILEAMMLMAREISEAVEVVGKMRLDKDDIRELKFLIPGYQVVFDQTVAVRAQEIMAKIESMYKALITTKGKKTGAADDGLSRGRAPGLQGEGSDNTHFM